MSFTNDEDRDAITQSVDGSIETISHQVDRLTIRIDDTFDGFKHRYEQAVPVFQSARFESLVERGVDWQTVLEATAENASHDFILYWSHDFTSLMSLAGDRGRCVEYLMGNHTIAEKMYRYNPAILLYAPLRTAILEDTDGVTWFAVDQPSTRFASFSTPEITAVGVELDRKLAALLAILDAPVPTALTESWANTTHSPSAKEGQCHEPGPEGSGDVPRCRLSVSELTPPRAPRTTTSVIPSSRRRP